MSVPVPLSGVPTGLREGSRLVLIVTPKAAGATAPPVLVEATVAAVPRNLGELVGGGDSNQSTVALSVEVAPESAAVVGPAEAVAVAVLAADAPFPAAACSERRVDAVDDGGGRLMGGVVAVCAAAGTVTSTTCALALASSMPSGQPVLFAECDPSGGDLAAWAELRETPGWSTAVAGGDRSWTGLRAHFQEMPSGLSVLCAPTQARTARAGGARVGGPVRVAAGLDVGRGHGR